jgi:hypothetical protein
VAHKGSWLRMSQISRLSDQSGPMSDSLVARSTRTDCSIAAAAGETLSRRAPPAFPCLAFLRVWAAAFSGRSGASTKIKFSGLFWAAKTGTGSWVGPRARKRVHETRWIGTCVLCCVGPKNEGALRRMLTLVGTRFSKVYVMCWNYCTNNSCL